MYSPIKSPQLYKYVATQIKDRIISGDLETGDRLPPEQGLAEQFEVSRTVVREAIKALEREGLVEVQQGRGTYVTDGTSTAFKESFALMMSMGSDQIFADLVEVRALLEPGIVAMAASRATDEDYEVLEQAVATMEASLDDPETFVRADSVFHMALAKATKNELIVKMIEPIVDLLHEMRVSISEAPAGLQRGQYHHVRILAAVKSRDPEAARQAMLLHMEQIQEDINPVRDSI